MTLHARLSTARVGADGMLALIREAAAASAALGRQVWIWRTGDGRLDAGLAYRREMGTYVCRCCGRELVR
jgi:hypothetical protein